jgi:hypothetical protein
MASADALGKNACGDALGIVKAWELLA